MTVNQEENVQIYENVQLNAIDNT